jgi:hypothetical protein
VNLRSFREEQKARAQISLRSFESVYRSVVL